MRTNVRELTDYFIALDPTFVPDDSWELYYKTYVSREN